MIDLHTHTKYSDGSWSLKELLKNAEKAGIEILSITDHDNVKAHKELKKTDYNEMFSGTIISGIECNAVFDNAKIELLGYNFNVDTIDKWAEDIYVDLNQEFKLIIAACKKNNIKVDDIKYDPSMGWPIDTIFKEMKKHKENRNKFDPKEWEDIDYFFRCCTCNTEFPLYIDFSSQVPGAKTVSNKIRETGGKVFLAHLYTYPLKDHILYLDKLRKQNIIDGVEVYYSKFSREQTKTLENYCEKHNLLMSGGSDCHGDKKPDIKIGTGKGNLNISKDIIKNWH